MIKQFIHIFRDSPNSFQGQKEGERVMLLLRKHIFTIIVRVGFLFILGLVPIVSLFFLSAQIEGAKLMHVFLLLSSLWYLLLWLALFYALTLYTLRTVIITDRRVIDNDQRALFNLKVSELHSHRIQDVTIHTNGFIETLLKFGNVVVQTAGSEAHFTFRQMPDPNKVKDTIMHITAAKHSGVVVK